MISLGLDGVTFLQNIYKPLEFMRSYILKEILIASAVSEIIRYKHIDKTSRQARTPSAAARVHSSVGGWVLKFSKLKKKISKRIITFVLI